MKYLLVQYAEMDHPSALLPFDEPSKIVAFLEKPENAFQKWEIYEIAREVPYTSRVTVKLIEGVKP